MGPSSRLYAAAVLAVTTASCAGPRSPHGGIATPTREVALPSAAAEPDASPGDASLDDAGYPSGADAGAPEVCEPTVCHSAEVTERDGCLTRPLSNTSCGTREVSSVCLAGLCIPRSGCGDGLRESGVGLAREACDDGALGDSDACDDFCQPRVMLFGSATNASAEPGAVAIASNYGHTTLLVWAETAGAETRVLGRRLGWAGVPIDTLDAPIVFGAVPTGFRAEPVVAGDAHGGYWVAWRTPEGTQLQRVERDGTLASPRQLLAPHARGVRLTAATESGLHVGYLAPETGQPHDAAWLQRLDAWGRNDGDPLRLSPAGAEAAQLELQTVGYSDVQAVWVGRTGPLEPARLLSRYVNGTTGPAATLSLPIGFAPTLRPVPFGRVSVLYQTTEHDPDSDIYAVTVSPSSIGAPLPVAALPGVAETAPRVAWLEMSGAALVYERDGAPALEWLGVSPPPEAAWLDGVLAATPNVSHLAAYPAMHGGAWVTWVSDTDGVDGHLRSFVGALLGHPVR